MAQENVAVTGVRNGDAEHGAVKAAVTFTGLKPQLVVEAPKAADAVQFYKAAFGAEELKRDMHPKRKADQELPLILSAELKVGSSLFIVSDHADQSPAAFSSGGSGCLLCLETDDVEGAVAKAVSAGAVAEGEISEGDTACCGNRVGKIKDPYGYVWLICSAGKNAANVDA